VILPIGSNEEEEATTIVTIIIIMTVIVAAAATVIATAITAAAISIAPHVQRMKGEAMRKNATNGRGMDHRHPPPIITPGMIVMVEMMIVLGSD
jgi:hypothetical protein